MLVRDRRMTWLMLSTSRPTVTSSSRQTTIRDAAAKLPIAEIEPPTQVKNRNHHPAQRDQSENKLGNPWNIGVFSWFNYLAYAADVQSIFFRAQLKSQSIGKTRSHHGGLEQARADLIGLLGSQKQADVRGGKSRSSPDMRQGRLAGLGSAAGYPHQEFDAETAGAATAGFAGSGGARLCGWLLAFLRISAISMVVDCPLRSASDKASSSSMTLSSTDFVDDPRLPPETFEQGQRGRMIDLTGDSAGIT